MDIGNSPAGPEFGIVPQALRFPQAVSFRGLDAFKGKIEELYVHRQYPLEVVREKMKDIGIHAT